MVLILTFATVRIGCGIKLLKQANISKLDWRFEISNRWNSLRRRSSEISLLLEISL